MLKMYKEILTKVSFDRQLFKKELFKALKWVGTPLELYQFRMWCIQEFGRKHPEVLKEVFQEIDSKKAH
jgi:hypothetical protein